VDVLAVTKSACSYLVARALKPPNAMNRATLITAWNAGLLIALMAPSVQAQESFAPIRDPLRHTSKYVISWKDLRAQNVVLQQRDYSCGAAALATVMRYYWGDPVNELAVLTVVERLLTPEEIADRVRQGLTLTDLRKTAVEMKYDAIIGRVELHELAASKVPVIVAIRIDGLDHFVVVRGMIGNWVYLADPTRGNLRIPVQLFAEQWIDNALLVIAKPGETSSPYDNLWVRIEEADIHWLNYQRVRKVPEQTFHANRP
jgi:predicted double-glycine peptidase